MALRCTHRNIHTSRTGATAVAKSKREGKITQKVMVQAALDEKGWEAASTELQAFIKEKYNVELATNIISNYKSVIKKDGGKGGAKGGGKGGAKRGRKPKVGVQFADLEAVQGMVSRLGADQVKKLVEMAELFA